MKNQSRIFEMISQEAIMGIIAFRNGGTECLYINPLAREILEVPQSSEGDPIPIRLADLYPIEEKPGVARAFKEEMLRHEGLYQDVLLRKKNGLVLIANVSIKNSTPQDGEEPLLLVMFQDITIQKKLQREVQVKQEEIHKAYQELLAQNKQLKELDLTKDKFLALTTHELRTPLAAIVATAEVLKLQLYDTSEQREEFIQTIHDQGLHLMEIVNDILDFAKIRAGKMEFYIEKIDLEAIVEKIAANFEHMATQAGVKVSVVKSSGPCLAWADLLRMKEVVNNVINNAIKYNKPGGSVTIRVSVADDFARITVTDTGLGIPADKIAHVFNEFETIGSVATHHKGTGLGMPISKGLMQKMGGNLSLESQVGVGSSFFIDVPITQVLDESMYRARPGAWDDLAA